MKQFILALFIFSSFFSCNQSSDRIMPASTGGPGQLLIIMANHKWEGKTGELVKEAISQDFEVLPQSEPLYDISHLPTEAYSKLMQRTRNILYTHISANVKESGVLIAYDKHSYPQIIISVKAKNDEEFIKLFKENQDKILSAYEKAERNRLLKGYKKKLLNKNLKKSLEENHNISINIPKGYNLDVDSSDFVWISRETPYSSQGILIWDYPYTDTIEFHLENLIAKRDSITKIRVEGEIEGSYMMAEDLITPEYYEFMLNDKYTVEIRGLWKMGGAEGVFMGGPFVSFSTVDSKRNRIVTVDCFSYGGKKKKRELIRQLEAILYSLKIKE